MRFLGELMNIGVLNMVNYVETLYDLQSGAESEKYVLVQLIKDSPSICPFCWQHSLM